MLCHCSGLSLVHMTLTHALNADWSKITTANVEESVHTVLCNYEHNDHMSTWSYLSCVLCLRLHGLLSVDFLYLAAYHSYYGMCAMISSRHGVGNVLFMCFANTNNIIL